MKKLLTLFLFPLLLAGYTPEELAAARQLLAEWSALPAKLAGTPAEFQLSSWEATLVRRELKKELPVEELDVPLLARFRRDCERGLAWREKSLEVTIPRLSAPPRLDGAIEPGEWASARRFEGEYRISETAKLPGRDSTRWYIGRYGNTLYVAASFDKEEPLAVYSDRYDGDRTRLIFQGDAFECMIRPELPYTLYLESIVNPEGKLWNLLHVRNDSGSQYRFADDFRAGLSAAARRSERGFTVELAIPLAALFGGWLSPDADAPFSFILIRTNRMKEGYFQSSPAPILYDSHNLSGYIRAKFE